MARLIDKSSGLSFDLQAGANTIGRRDENDICLPGGGVSRFHAEIRLERGSWVLEDQGSTYGSFVNGEKVEGSVPIKDGDRVRFAVTSHAPEGEFNLLFSEEAGAEGPSTVTRITRAVRAVVGRKRIEEGAASIESLPGKLLVRMTGVFRKRESDQLAAGIRGHVRKEPQTVALDVSHVDYMNSYALAILLELAGTQQEAGFKLRVFGATGTVLKLLSLPGEANPIEICNSEKEALA